MDCSICYDEITSATGKVELSCAHTFHFSCLTKWFGTQASNGNTQSCPCCRHESNDHEKMPDPIAVIEDDEDDDDDETEEYDDDSQDGDVIERNFIDRIDQAAADERAKMRFAKWKSEMTKDAFEAFAASRIASLFRGHCARYKVREIKDIRRVLRQNTMAVLQWGMTKRMDKRALAFNMKAFTMSHAAWRNYVASIIQAAWRAKLQKDKAKVAAMQQLRRTIGPLTQFASIRMDAWIELRMTEEPYAAGPTLLICDGSVE